MRGAKGFACAMVLPALAVGCGDDERAGELPGEAASAIQVCADGEVSPGIDVSYYQGTIDWDAVAADGIVFAITRTNHGDFMDPEFDNNWNGIREAGLIRGAYQYFDPGGDPIAQAMTLIEKVGVLEPGDLPPVIDVESTDGLSPAAIAANVGTWIDTVEGALGRKPIIYTGSYFWNDNVETDAFADHPLWIAHYTTQCPNMPDAWPDWSVWQYTSSGAVAGISGNVDRNRFNGPREAVHDLAGNGYRASVVSVDQPEVMHPGEVAQVRITLINEGARSWGAATKLGTSVPRDRQSPFSAPSWEAAHRVLAMPGEVPPGESVELVFEVIAPAEPGAYVEHFNLVEEAVAWFSDTPPGGGPSDDTIALSIEVQDGPRAPDDGDDPPGTGEGAGEAPVAFGLEGRVSCAFGRPTSSGLPVALVGLLVATRIGRLRRRRA